MSKEYYCGDIHNKKTQFPEPQNRKKNKIIINPVIILNLTCDCFEL